MMIFDTPFCIENHPTDEVRHIMEKHVGVSGTGALPVYGAD